MRWRAVGVLAALLCLVGVASGTATAPRALGHHTPAVAAATTLAGTQGTAARGDLHAIAPTTAATARHPGAVAAQPRSGTHPDLRAVATVRTRGPPALAA